MKLRFVAFAAVLALILGAWFPHGTALAPTCTSNCYYFSSSLGNDSNNCTTTSTPCQTITKLNSITYPTGSTIALLGGDTFTITAALELNGPGASGQNVDGAITVTNYGSGSCNVLARVTAGCATIQVSGSLTQAIIGVNLASCAFNNLRILGGTTAALALNIGNSASGGFYFDNHSGTNSGCTISNNEIVDFSVLFFMRTASGQFNNMTFENNYLHGSTISATVDAGFLLQGATGGSNVIQGNRITNIGGHVDSVSGYYDGCCGNGILLSNGGANWTDQFNVTSNFGANTNSCGGPAGNWTYEASNVTMQFDESYNGGPTSYTTGCDWDGFDIDGGSSYVTAQYLYSHGNYGPAFNWFQANESGYTFQYNIYRYSISENDDTLQSGAVSIGGATNISTHGAIYNLTIYTATVCLYFLDDSDIIFANNICWKTTGANEIVYSNVSAFHATMNGNNYYRTSGGSLTFKVPITGTIVIGLAAWQAAISQEANSVSENPNLTSAGNGGTCYPGGVVPTGPQNNPVGCPGPYVLQGGSPMIGIGIDLTQPPYSLNVGTRDYYGNTIPHGVGTGFNIGADGGNP